MRLRQPPPAVAFAACILIWGGSWLAIKAAVAHADPLGVAALRTGMAFAFLWLLGRALRVAPPTLAQIFRAMLIGSLFIGVNFALVYWSASRVPTGFASLAYSTAPLQTLMLAPVLGRREPVHWGRLAAALLGPLGVAVAFGGLRTGGSVSLLVTVVVLLAATTSAAGTLLARRWSDAHPLWTNAYANLAGTLLLATIHVATPRGPMLPQGPWAWAGFLYMLLGGSVLAMGLYFGLVREWDAARSSFTTLTTPFVALGLGSLVAHEPLDASELIGAALVLGSGLLALRGARTRATPSAGTAQPPESARLNTVRPD